MMVGVLPIGIAIEGKTCLYERKHCIGKDSYQWDKPLPPDEWPHPSWRTDILETSNLISYPTEIFSDGSKTGDTVGAGVAVYNDKKLVMKFKYKLQKHCSNNQEEQITILKSLENLPTLTDQPNRKTAIYTDSKMTLDSLKNYNIHNVLIEAIRNRVRQLTKRDWTIHFGWVNTHTGIGGNELADSLAKEVAQKEGENIYVYDRIPLSTIAYTIKEEGLKKWQTQWERAEKGAICRTFFPNIKQSLNVRLPITPEFTVIVSGHRKTRFYLKRFKLTDESKCPCIEGE
jgi:ribonuclease HI